MLFIFKIKGIIQIYICIGKIYAIPETPECWHRQGFTVLLLNKYKFNFTKK